MNYIEEIKTKLAAGAQAPDIFAYAPECFNINDIINKDFNLEPIASAQAALGCFEPIEIPDSTYQNSTTKLDIAGLIPNNQYSSISDGNLIVSFNVPLTRLTVPTNWNPWGNPPFVESSQPPILFSDFGVSSLTLNLSKPCCAFGFELMPNLLTSITCTVQFYAGAELVGTITKVTPANARLFAAKTCCCTPFDRVEISIDEPFFGFSIAQVRYNTDCSSKCDCCCSAATPVTIPACHDYATLSLEVTQLSCTGRLLNVAVTVTACEKRSVVVGVIVCDTTGTKVLRFKACEACMPESTNPQVPCVKHDFNFCFVFEEDSCKNLSLQVKTIVNYACFDFPCNC